MIGRRDAYDSLHPMRLFVTAALLLPLLASCTSSVRFTDVMKADWSPETTVLRKTSTSVTFKVRQHSPVWLGDIKARVIGADVYLDPVMISSVVHRSEFTVDLGSPQFPKDWQQRLYWIEGESIPSPVNPFVKERVREIKRRKIEL